jgi:hypothetical protein
VRRNDTALLGVLACVLVVGAVLLAPSGGGEGPNFQVAGRGQFGLSGLAAGLQSAGVPVRQRDLPTLANGLTVVVEPQYVSHADAASWMRSLRGGATMVYATAEPDVFTRSLGVGWTEGGSVIRTRSGQRAFPQAAVPAGAFAAFRPPSTARSLYDVPGGASAGAVIPVGRGTVWLFSDPRWLTNDHVAGTGLPVVLPIAAAAGGAVSFDVYHQTAAGHMNVLDYMPQWASLLALEAVLAGLLWAIAMSRRAGPVRIPPSAEPAYLGELAPSLAELYAKAGDVRAVTEPLANSVAREPGAGRARVAEALARLRAAADVRTAVQAWGDVLTARRRG